MSSHWQSLSLNFRSMKFTSWPSESDESTNLSENWREIQGARAWKKLLPSLSNRLRFDNSVREEIIRYGEFAQACYDGFEYDEDSPQTGNSKFAKDKLLESVNLPRTGYEITKYIYATSELWLPAFFRHTSESHGGDTWSQDSNWMGFVAVATSEDEIRRLGRRDVVVAWRGTVTSLEWVENIKDLLRPTGLDPRDELTDGVKVEAGFLNIYTSSMPGSKFNSQSARVQVLSEIVRLINLYKDDVHDLSISVTGHSLGGALALLSAYDIAELGVNGNGEFRCGHSIPFPKEMPELGISPEQFKRSVPVTVFSFSAPRLGNRMFRDRCDHVGLHVLRVFNVRDMVPKVPGLLVNEDSYLLRLFDVFPWAYTHVGTELELDSDASPYLREDAGASEQHNLEALLHLVDGYQGPGRSFRPSGRRDIALVNKSSDFLKPELGVQLCWRSS